MPITLYGYVQSTTNNIRMQRGYGWGKIKLHLFLNQPNMRLSKVKSDLILLQLVDKSDFMASLQHFHLQSGFLWKKENFPTKSSGLWFKVEMKKILRC